MVTKKAKVENTEKCGKCEENKELKFKSSKFGDVCETCHTELSQSNLQFDEYDLKPDELTMEMFADKAKVTVRNAQIWLAGGKIKGEKVRRRVNGTVRKQVIFKLKDVEDFLESENSPVIKPKVEKMDAIEKTNDNENKFSEASHLFVFDAVEKITENLKQLNMQQQLPPAPPEKQSQFLTIKEASDETRLAESEIRRMIDAKEIRSFPGKRGLKLVSRKEIESL